MSYNKTSLRGLLVVVLGGLAATIITTLIIFALVKLLWDSTIHMIFPGFVEQGFIASSISFWTAAKLSVLFAIIGGAFINLRANQNS